MPGVWRVGDPRVGRGDPGPGEQALSDGRAVAVAVGEHRLAGQASGDRSTPGGDASLSKVDESTAGAAADLQHDARVTQQLWAGP